MVTVYGERGKFNVCYDNENVLRYSFAEFLSDKIVKILGDHGDVFFYNLKFWGLPIIKSLHELGFIDTTEAGLINGGKISIDKGEYGYILSADNGAFYRISYNKYGPKKNVNIYEFNNMVPVDIAQVTEDFGGEACVAMHRACNEIRALGTRGGTISSAAYSVWKRGFDRTGFKSMFHELDGKEEKICRDAYFGGICMVAKDNYHTYEDGMILDVNSLYPYVMKNCRFPIGKSHYGEGRPQDAVMNSSRISYYVRFNAIFKLKDNHIPFIKTRCDKRHWQLEVLETSDYIDPQGKLYTHYETETVDEWGEIFRGVERIRVRLCLYKADYELFLEQYDVEDIEFEEYVWWYNGNVFENYVNRFYDMKKNAKNKAEKRIAKILLNALSGRMAYKKDRKSAFFDNRSFELLSERNMMEGHIRRDQKGKHTEHFFGDTTLSYAADIVDVHMDSDSHVEIGAAITSEARAFIIRKAQANYEHFLYTDTDSLHLDCGIDELVDITISDELGDFKVEKEFIAARYTCEKVYVTLDKSGKFELTAAGLPKECINMIEECYDPSEGLVLYSGHEDLKEKYGALLKKFYNMNCVHLQKGTNEYVEVHDIVTIDNLKVPRYEYRIKDYNTFEIEKKVAWYNVDNVKRK